MSRYSSAPDPSSRSATASSTGWLDSRTPSTWPIALGTRSTSVIGASPTRCTGRSSAARPATSSASLLLPAPPGPQIVTSRAPPTSSMFSIRARASSRPTSRWCSAGRLVAVSVLSGGKSSRSSRATSWKRRTALGTSFRRCRPRGRYEAPGSGSSPETSRVACETTTCSPCEAEQIRDAITTSMPTYPSGPSSGSPVCRPIRRR